MWKAPNALDVARLLTHWLLPEKLSSTTAQKWWWVGSVQLGQAGEVKIETAAASLLNSLWVVLTLGFVLQPTRNQPQQHPICSLSFVCLGMFTVQVYLGSSYDYVMGLLCTLSKTWDRAQHLCLKHYGCVWKVRKMGILSYSYTTVNNFSYLNRNPATKYKCQIATRFSACHAYITVVLDFPFIE